MSKFSILFLLIFSTYCQAQTIYPSGVSGCIARWTFDAAEGGNLGTIQDWSGNNNHGSNNNIVSSAGWKGMPFTAGKFDGSSSYSQVPFNGNFLTNQITALALVKFDGYFAGSCQGNNIVYNGFNYNSDLNWSLYTSDNVYDGSCSIYSPAYNKTYFSTPNYTNVNIPPNNYIDSAKWYLIGCTFNGSSINYYEIIMDSSNKLNNISPSYSGNSNYPVGNGIYDIFIGATQNPPFPYWFNGKMDELILFDKALTNAEIQSVYDYLYGAPTLSSDVTAQSNLQIFCQQKIVYVQGAANNVQRINVLDLSGNLLRSVQDQSVIELNSFATQIVIVKVLTRDNKVSIHKILLTE